MSRRYSIFDAATIGTSLDVTHGGLVLTTEVPSLSIDRTARLSVAAQDYESFAQFIVFGLTGTSIANKISIGVVTADASLSTYVGGDAEGIGYRLGEGQIHNNGSSVQSVTTGALGDVISVRYIPDGAGSGTLAWYRGALLVAARTVPVAMQGEPLYLACSLGSTTDPGDLSIYVNSGRDWYETPIIGNAAGWWEVNTLPGTLRFADVPFIGSKDDVMPYQRWEGGITSDRIDDDRGVHFWIWGSARDQARSSAAVVDIIDSEGRLDDTFGGIYRDQPAELKLIGTDGYDAGQTLGSFIIDSIKPIDALKRRVTLKGPLSAFEVPMLRLAIRPDADPDAFGNYYPMLIGPAFSCPVRLLHKAIRDYALDAVGTNALGKVRDNGVALDPTVPDYTLDAGGKTITLANEPYGTVTADAAGTGAGYSPPGAPDVLDGDGDPFIPDSNDNPENWTVIDAVSGKEPVVSPSYGNRLVLFSPEGEGRIKHDTATLTAGRSYRWQIEIYMIRQHSGGGGNIAVGFGRSETGYANPFWQAQSKYAGTAPGCTVDGNNYSTPRIFEGVYTPAVNHAPIIWWRDSAINSPYTISAVISKVQFVELPEPEDGSEDEIEAEIAALARPLEDMLRQGIEERCGLSPSVWDSASAAAVDVATGFEGQGYWAHNQTVLRDYINELLAPYTASAFEASDGKLTIARLVDPEASATTGADITGSDILNDPLPEWDEMPGLTCSIGCRKNEHVFSADELGDALPWAARPKLTKPYRYVRRYGGPLAAGLEHARAASTLDSRLVLPDEAQAAIDHAGALASVSRNFFTIRVPESGRWEPGQVCNMYLPRWFRDNNGWRHVYVVRVKNSRRPFGELIVWTRGD